MYMLCSLIILSLYKRTDDKSIDLSVSTMLIVIDVSIYATSNLTACKFVQIRLEEKALAHKACAISTSAKIAVIAAQ